MRLERDHEFMWRAILASMRSTCSRRSVGCVFVNGRGREISRGYNGVPKGSVHCIDKPCAGASLPSGTGLDKCEAVHAEENAILNCQDITKVHSIYCTTAPCDRCYRMLVNTPARKLYYLQDYPGFHPRRWLQADKELYKVELPQSITLINPAIGALIK